MTRAMSATPISWVRNQGASGTSTRSAGSRAKRASQ